MDRKTLVGIAFVFLAAFIWSFAGLFIKVANASSIWIIFIRSLTAGVILIPFILKRKITPFKSVLFAGICFFLYQVVYTLTIKLGTSALAVSMQAAAPFYTVIIFMARTKEINWKKVPVLGTILLGVILTVVDSWRYTNPVTIFLGMFVGLTFVGYASMLQRIKTGSPMGIIAVVNLLTALFTLPILPLDFNPMPSTLFDFGILISSGVLFTALGYSLYGAGVKRLKIEIAFVMGLVEPILNPIWVFSVTNEAPGQWTMLGMIVIITGAVINVFIPQEIKKATPTTENTTT